MPTYWTVPQQQAVAIIPKFTGILSLLGSSWIITEICTDREKLYNVYHRLLLAMSVYDVLESVWNVASTWPIPRGTQGIWGAAGNQQTCTAQGFFLQLGLGVPIYNASLSVYYLLVIRYSFQEARISHMFEPIMHVLAFIYSFGTALAALLLEQYNNANLWCWIAPFPADCLDTRRYGDQGNCVRGNNAWIYRWAFYFGPLWSCILVAMLAMLVMYRAVFKREAATVRYRHPTLSLDPTTTRASVINANASRDSMSRRQGSIQAVSRRFSSILRREAAEQQQQQQNPRSREVLHQAIWYLLTFCMTHVFSTINRILQQTRGETYYALVVCHAFFDPFQGFFNFLVYRRPRYLRYRKNNPSKSRWFAVKSTLRFSYIETRKSQRLRMQQYDFSSSSIPAESPSGSAQQLDSNDSELSDSYRRQSGLLLLVNPNMATIPECRSVSSSSFDTKEELNAGHVHFADGPIPGDSRRRTLTAVDEVDYEEDSALQLHGVEEQDMKGAETQTGKNQGGQQ